MDGGECCAGAGHVAGRRPAAARAPPAFSTAPAPLTALPSPTLADASHGNANFTRKPVCTATIFTGISRRDLDDRFVLLGMFTLFELSKSNFTDRSFLVFEGNIIKRYSNQITRNLN